MSYHERHDVTNHRQLMTVSSHYCDVIMGAIASQITSLTIVYPTVYSDADQRKHQSSAPLAFVRGIHLVPVNSPHKWPVTRKMFPLDNVIIFTYFLPSAPSYCRTPSLSSVTRFITLQLAGDLLPVCHQPTTHHLRYLRIVSWTERPSMPWWRHQMETFSTLLAFVRGIHRSPVNSPHKGQWRGALMFSLIAPGDLRRHRANYDVTVMHRIKRFVIYGLDSELGGWSYGHGSFQLIQP